MCSPGIAAAHGIDADVSADYDEGKRRGVRGSPDFWVGGAEFFCPALDLSHDGDGALAVNFDPAGLSHFVAAAVG
jgi:hypothetical protein